MEHVKLATVLALAVIVIAIFANNRKKDEETSDTAEGTSSKKAAVVSARAAWNAAPGLKFLSPTGSDIVLRDVQTDILDKSYKYSQHLDGLRKNYVDKLRRDDNLPGRISALQNQIKALENKLTNTEKNRADTWKAVYSHQYSPSYEEFKKCITDQSIIRLQNTASSRYLKHENDSAGQTNFRDNKKSHKTSDFKVIKR